jgi:23S rRNA (pseudouridine1915-N3)-methyltransferase
MKIKLIWVGKTRERFIREGVEKYIAWVRPYADLDVTELKEEKGNDVARMVEREGERILKLQIPYILLDEQGQGYTSVEFARFLERSGPVVNIVIGGAYGVSREVRDRARATIALSAMTLTHEMSRLLLLEQLYRAFSIINKRGYHH